MLIKNTYGYSVIPNPKFINPEFLNQCRGSSLDRKNEPEKKVKEKKAEKPVKEKKEKQERELSPRTKSKIKKKLFSFFGLYKRLTFLTLTFVNLVEDEIALKLLGKFLDNAKKQDAGFEYLWVAERQTKNEIFKENIHFHIVSNKYWKIEKYWNYWLKIQEKCGIVPRGSEFKPSSAFDVKQITSQNSKGIGTYLTKYVTKNTSKFKFMPWNCSKKISMLYTDFYSDFSFLRNLERLEANNMIEMKRIRKEYCNLVSYTLNKTTMKFYDRITDANKAVWNNHN